MRVMTASSVTFWRAIVVLLEVLTCTSCQPQDDNTNYKRYFAPRNDQKQPTTYCKVSINSSSSRQEFSSGSTHSNPPYGHTTYAYRSPDWYNSPTNFVSVCRDLSCQDFATKLMATQEERTDVTYQRFLLSLHELYTLPEFRAFIKEHIPAYPTYIKALHAFYAHPAHPR